MTEGRQAVGDFAIDETLLCYQQQVAVAAAEYQQIEKTCETLLVRADEHGVLSLDSAEIIGVIQTYGAATRAYHAALMQLIRYIGCDGNDDARLAACQRLLRRVQALERQHKHYLLCLDKLVVAFLHVVEQTMPHAGIATYVRSASTLPFMDGRRPGQPTASAHASGDAAHDGLVIG
jgi:hypothetical protein